MKLLIVSLIALTFMVGSVSAIPAHVSICELTTFVGGGNLDIGTYHENGLTLIVTDIYRDIYSILLIGNGASLTGYIIAPNGMNYNIDNTARNYMSVSKSSFTFMDANYCIELNGSIEWDKYFDRNYRELEMITKKW